IRGQDAGSSGLKPSGGSSSTGKRTAAGTVMVSEYDSDGIELIVARCIPGDKPRAHPFKPRAVSSAVVLGHHRRVTRNAGTYAFQTTSRDYTAHRARSHGTMISSATRSCGCAS